MTSRTIRWLFATLSLAMGAAFIAGGPARVSASAYQVVVDTGGPYWWGAWFLTVGALTAFLPGLLRWTLLLGGVAFSILAAAFTLAAVASPVANLTATVAYGWITILHVMASEKIREGHVIWAPKLSPRSWAG